METLETLAAAEPKPSSAQTLETPVEERVIDSSGLSETHTELGFQLETPVTGIKDNGFRVSANGVKVDDNTNGDSTFMVEDSVVKMSDGNGCELMERNAPVEEIVTVLDENKNNGFCGGRGIEVSSLMDGDVVLETQIVESGISEEVVSVTEVAMAVAENGNGTESVVDGIHNVLAGVSLGDEEHKKQNDSVEGVDGEDGAMKEGVDGEGGVACSDGPDGGTLGRQTDEILAEEKQATATPEGKEEDGDEEDEEEMNNENKFSVGDFVWGKIKSHPWWPGHVYNPSDASEYAEKYHREGRLLVAYFGDRTFAWCKPSQLRPFLEDFEQMSKQSNSKTFVNAVENALDEFGWCVELEMTCSCVQIDPPFARSVAVNAGIKEGVSVPTGGIGEVFSINGFEPINFLAGLRDTAQDVCMSSLLELTVFRSRLSAFSRAKGYGQLPMYRQHEGITDPEDNADGEITKCPTEDDWLSSPTGPWTRKSSLRSYQKVPSFSQEKLYQRKKRSMAELMAENVDSERGNEDSTIENGSDAVEESKVDRKSALSSRKHRKTKRSESPSAKAENKTPDKENGAKEEMVSSPRVRKKSKYLSPPYTMLGLHRSFSSKDAEKETPKSTNDSQDGECISSKDTEIEVPKGRKVSRVGERISKIAGQLTGSPLMIKCNGETSQKKVAKEARAGRNISDSLSPQTPKANQKTLVLDEDGASADEMLSEFRSAALDTLYLKKKRRSSDVTVGFFSRFRSSLYRDGTNFETYKKYLTDSNGKKRKKPSDAKRGSSVPIDARRGSSVPIVPIHAKHGSSVPIDVRRGSLVKNSHDTNPSEGKPGQKKRKSKEETSGKNSHETDPSEGKPERKKRKSKEEALGKNSHETDPSESKPERKKRKSKEEALGKNSHETDPSEGKPGQKKRKSKEEALVKDSHETDPSEGKPGRKRRKRKEEARNANHKEAKGDKTLAALLLTFAPGFALPSKENLVKVFSRFGVVNESATEILKDSGCAQIVFQKTSDAEEAFNSSDKIVDFGSGIASYRLRFLSGSSRESDGNVRLVDKEPPPSSSQVAAEAPLLFIQKNLETMASMLIKSPDKLSPQERANLEGEIRGLLKKVNKMVESST